MVQVEAMRKERPEIPDQIDVLIVGGGTGGASLAGIIAKETKLSVVLLEAGPDYGPIDGNRWPRDLLDARELAYSHDWGYEGVAHPSQGQPLPFHRARVIGGCSAHNYCIALIGHRRDYDHWAELGNPGWDWDSVRPAFERAKGAMAIRIPQEPELTPYHAAYIEAARSFGIPRVTDLNHPDESVGIAPIPFNIYDGIRWNSAFAYLDPVRERPNLTIVDHVLVDRVVVENGRVVAVVAVIGGERRTVAGGRVVLCAGAYA
jgi:choline dehydrogenase